MNTFSTFEVSYTLYQKDLAKSIIACTDTVIAIDEVDAVECAFEFISKRDRKRRKNISVKLIGEAPNKPRLGRDWEVCRGARTIIGNYR